MKLLAQGFLGWAGAYFRENWGAPFVLGFMGLLAATAVCLAWGFDWLADKLAICAYYTLVVGVVLQLACFVKASAVKKERQETE